jgi:hypothetical protein
LEHFEVIVEGFETKDVADYTKAEHNIKEFQLQYRSTE